MSDHILVVVPKDPQFVPRRANRAEVVDLLTAHCSGMDDLEVFLTDKLRFFGGAENVESLTCPACAATVSNDTLHDVFQLIDEHNENDLEETTFEATCCGAVVPVVDVTFRDPCAFARCGFQITTPDVDWLYAPPPGSLRDAVENAMGGPALFLWFHV